MRKENVTCDVKYVGMMGIVMDGFLAGSLAALQSGFVTSRGHAGQQFWMQIEPGWLDILAEGEPDPRLFGEAFREVEASGQLAGPLSVLVDITRYTGVVAWDHLFEMRSRINWGLLTPVHIAYIVRDNAFVPIVKVASVVFPDAEHKTFLRRRDALSWLAVRQEEALTCSELRQVRVV